jgi:type I restriction enzyme S subunit
VSVENNTRESLGEIGVSVEQLITEHLDIWTAADTEKKSGRGRSSGSAGSVYGIKKLRELILELAVRGKLVPQDESDEPASELLKRIQYEKAKLIAEGKIKKDKLFPKITEGEKPFKLPLNWEWTRLGNLFDVVYGKGLANTELTEEGYEVFGANGIIGYYSSYLYSESQLLVSCRGAYSGKPNISPPLCFITSNTLVLQNTWKCLDLKFFFYSLTIADKEKIVTGSAQPQVTTTNIDPFLVVLPPLEEQHRIVAKVDELMALCDQLENQHNNATEAHEKLVTHLLGTLTQSQNAEDFNTQWQRISEHFDTLFTTEASIDALKQTLLQLAVMGKLVPQDLNDEPASELLKRIQAEKTKLIAEGKIKKDKPLAEISEEEKPFDLAVGWVWTRLGNISQLKGGMAYQSTAFVETGKNQVIRMGNVRPWRLRVDEKAVFIDDSVADKTMEYSLNIDDIVITMTGTIGKRDYVYSARIHESDVQHKKLFLNQRLCSVRPYFVKPLYLDMAMKDDRLLDVIFSNATGTANQANISMSSLNLWLIPTPPINEQHRIVAKVHELMAICDQLKVRITSSNQLQQKLADVMVEQAIN